MTSSIPTPAANGERQSIPVPIGAGDPSCPTCGGRMWDNRQSKRNPKAPDFKCRTRSCDGVLWPGQYHVAVPVTQLPRLAEFRNDAAPREPEDEVTPPLAVLRQKYLDITDFVLDSVRPRYAAYGLDCAPDTVAAITATLYIAETRRDGL